MRIDLKKVLFIGLEKDKEALFQMAQELGIIHFTSSKPSQITDIPEDNHHYLAAVKILNTQPLSGQEELSDFSQADEIVEEILHQKHQLEDLQEQQRVLALEIERISPFGNYSPDEITWIEREGRCKLQFFCAKNGFAGSDQAPEEAVHVATEHGLDYFITVNPHQKTYECMIEIKPHGSLNYLKDKLHLLKQKTLETESTLRDLARFNTFLHKALIEKSNIHRLSAAQNHTNSAIEDKVFTVEGWVPENKMPLLKLATSPLNIYLEPVAIDSSDTVPTYLENEGLSRLGEDLVNIYDTPSKRDKDPSLWVLFFFAIFFAIIIGDGGYGLILLLAGLYAKFKMTSTSKAKQRFLNLSLILGSFCIVWGLLTTSFFGITVSPDSPLRKLSLVTWLAEKKAEYHFRLQDHVAMEWLEQFPSLEKISQPSQMFMTASTVDSASGAISYPMLNDFSNDILLEFALFIGVIHICLSFMRNLIRNLAGLGWIVFLGGCYMYFPQFLSTTSLIHFAFGINPHQGAQVAVWMIFGGISLAIIIAMIKDKLFGLLECMNVLQIFGDVMSYLRLYALGLSGALVVNTSNELASDLPIPFAIVVLIIAHSINLVLCIMGGVIHGLRLNFLEWYHYSFEGGGKQFNPLRKIEID